MRRWSALLAALGFIALTVLVDRHVTDELDRDAFGWFRPGGRWGPLQVLGDVVLNLLQPAVTGAAFGIVALCTRSRSVVVRALATIALTTLVVVLLKQLVDRPDVHGSTAGLGGSYPSGHMVALIVYGAGLLGLLRRDQLLVVPAATLLGLALLITGTHWLTDVVAGALVGVVLTALVRTPPWRGNDRRRRREGRQFPTMAGKSR